VWFQRANFCRVLSRDNPEKLGDGRADPGGLVTVAGEHRVSKTGPPSTLRFVFVLVIQALPLAERYRRR